MRSTADELSTRARILSAALVRFAVDGMAKATVRAIAAEAGVSAGLVVHHFGSRDGLRAACDAHVRTMIREGKEKALADGAQVDALQALRMADERLPIMRYLASALAGGGPQAAALFDDLVADAEVYVQRSIDTGLMRPTDDLHATVVVLTTWQLGALVLHEHVGRLLGADLTGDMAGIAAWMRPAGRLLSEGVMTEQGTALLRAMEAAMDAQVAAQPDPSPDVQRPDLPHPADPESPDPPTGG